MSRHHIGPETISRFAVILLGAAILSFGLYNIHERTNITEGGVLGLTLLIQHWSGVSPSLSNPVMDAVCYLLAFRYLGHDFAKNAIAATLAFSGFHGIWELLPPLLPNLSDYPALAAVAGAVFVGFGVGLIVRVGGASSGDDALALTLSHMTGWSLTRCYLMTDLTVLGLSLSYISPRRMVYSLITVTLSSLIIGKVQSWTPIPATEK